jgi:amidase
MALDVDELSTMDATAQAELVRRRELTPLELVDAAIARIERVNPAINAVITPLFEEARAAAVSRELPTGPFRGAPFLLKGPCRDAEGTSFPVFFLMGVLFELPHSVRKRTPRGV